MQDTPNFRRWIDNTHHRLWGSGGRLPRLSLGLSLWLLHLNLAWHRGSPTLSWLKEQIRNLSLAVNKQQARSKIDWSNYPRFSQRTRGKLKQKSKVSHVCLCATSCIYRSTLGKWVQALLRPPKRKFRVYEYGNCWSTDVYIRRIMKTSLSLPWWGPYRLLLGILFFQSWHRQAQRWVKDRGEEAEALLCVSRDKEGTWHLHCGKWRGKLPRTYRGAQSLSQETWLQYMIRICIAARTLSQYNYTVHTIPSLRMRRISGVGYIPPGVGSSERAGARGAVHSKKIHLLDPPAARA